MCVVGWYRSTAKTWLQAQSQQVGEVRLIADGSKIGFGYQLLMVSLAYRHRNKAVSQKNCFGN